MRHPRADSRRSSQLSADDALKISYDLSPREMNRALAWLGARHPFNIAVRLLILLVGSVLAFLDVHSGQTLFRAILVQVVVPLALCEAVLRVAMRLGLRISYSTSAKGFAGPHEIVLSPGGLTESTPVNNTTHSWEAVTSIVENSDFVFLKLSHAMAHIVPKRAFSSDADMEAFVRFARARTSDAA